MHIIKSTVVVCGRTDRFTSTRSISSTSLTNNKFKSTKHKLYFGKKRALPRPEMLLKMNLGEEKQLWFSDLLKIFYFVFVFHKASKLNNLLSAKNHTVTIAVTDTLVIHCLANKFAKQHFLLTALLN